MSRRPAGGRASDAAPDDSRRRFLAGGCRLAAAAICFPVVPLVAGCNGDDQPHEREPLRVALDRLGQDERFAVVHGDRTVELIRHGDEVTARLLLCTHQGCDVKWLPDDRAYLCPCHDGRFDADGNPIYGPPRYPLAMLPVTVRDGEVIVDV